MSQFDVIETVVIWHVGHRELYQGQKSDKHPGEQQFDPAIFQQWKQISGPGALDFERTNLGYPMCWGEGGVFLLHGITFRCSNKGLADDKIRKPRFEMDMRGSA
jgi:hypothetical protein